MAKSKTFEEGTNVGEVMDWVMEQYPAGYVGAGPDEQYVTRNKIKIIITVYGEEKQEARSDSDSPGTGLLGESIHDQGCAQAPE